MLFAVDTSSGRGQLGKFSNDVSMETRQRVTCVLSLNTGKAFCSILLRFWNDVKTHQYQREAYILFPPHISESEKISDEILQTLASPRGSISALFPPSFTAHEALTISHKWTFLLFVVRKHHTKSKKTNNSKSSRPNWGWNISVDFELKNSGSGIHRDVWPAAITMIFLTVEVFAPCWSVIIISCWLSQER